MKKRYVIGVDFGTDSVRSIIVDALNGNEISSAVYYYPRWKEGLHCNASLNQFRQHPSDYIEGLQNTISQSVSNAGPSIAKEIKAISVDTTGSTPVAVTKEGIPLALIPEFSNNPNAMFFLWKDHTAIREATEINIHAAKSTVNYLKYVGGIYSSEWFWAKLLHVLREDKEIRENCYSWVEHCDWIPFLLTGGKDVHAMKRGVCSAGHKSLWSEEWNGLPSDSFFSSLDPLLKGFRSRLFSQVYTADKASGHLSPEWAQRLGLHSDVIVGIGAFDAHMGAVGGQIEPYFLSKVMGTSTCDMLIAPPEEIDTRLVQGICGQVPGSVIPGMMGMEAGQSAFGDAYAWFKDLLSWPLKNLLLNADNPDQAKSISIINEASEKIISALSREASMLPLNKESELSVDWFNGRRTPDANQLLKGAITGLSLGTGAPAVFRSIVEATCFGAKAIVERFNEQGINVKGLIGLGGVARKSPFIMQMMADVINLPIRIHKSEQTCALGAAMFAATAAGIYSKVEEAMEAMGQGFDLEYFPDPEKVEIYSERYKRYTALGKFIEQQTKAMSFEL